MYLTVKQQIKHLSKEDYRTIKKLCHIAKSLTNEAIYNIRQYYFENSKFLKYEQNYQLLKSSPNYNKRIHRGLYKTANGKTFNADVNGALNIMRKSNVVDLRILYDKGGVDTPIRIRIA